MATRVNQGLEEKELPTTSYAVLGLLTFGEMSGYDLAKVADQSIAFFLTPAKSQIYSELRRLLSLGYATEREVEQDRRPDKRVYRITDRGRRALREWLETAEVESAEIKSPFLVKVFFGAHMSKEALLGQVKEMRRRDAEQLQVLKQIETLIQDQDEMFFPNLTLRCGLAHTRAVIRWEDEVIRELDRREES
ncbi:MAG TPA: PadR family transcriptional regulator [Actinomycetota bacterium]|jgi:DNA-binding PadR family transcriptional regulator|nr:PadR family transcriptional regulator [Actinomycetota bacterium]